MTDPKPEPDELATKVAPFAHDPSRASLAFVVIFLGGFVGAVLREIATPLLPGTWEPTMLINTVACFLIGLLYGHRDRVHHHLFHFGAIGFCGGLSTFSHFVQDVDGAVVAGGLLGGVAPILTTLVGGIGAAALGEALARRARA